MSLLRSTLVLYGATLLLGGLLYPLGLGALAQGVAPDAARGDLLVRDGVVVGAARIGQAFTAPGFFWGRPSASGYDPMASGGTNLAPGGAAQAQRVAAAAAAWSAQNAGPPPPELLAASGSGLDPDISVAAARAQVPRVAAARGVDPAALEAQIAALTQTGFGGPPRVNVLALNLALLTP